MASPNPDILTQILSAVNGVSVKLSEMDQRVKNLENSDKNNKRKLDTLGRENSKLAEQNKMLKDAGSFLVLQSTMSTLQRTTGDAFSILVQDGKFKEYLEEADLTYDSVQFIRELEDAEFNDILSEAKKVLTTHRREETLLGINRKVNLEVTNIDYWPVVKLFALFHDGRNYCGSGVLIDSNHVLTAAHNFVYLRDESLLAQYLHHHQRRVKHVAVVAGLRGEAKECLEKVISRATVHIPETYMQNPGLRLMSDYAVLRLEEGFTRIPGLKIFKGDIRVELNQPQIPHIMTLVGDKFRICGYGYNKTGDSYDGHRLEMAKAMISKVGEVIYHNGDSTPGQSGGPILNEQNEVVGVHVRGYNLEESAFKANEATFINEDKITSLLHDSHPKIILRCKLPSDKEED